MDFIEILAVLIIIILVYRVYVFFSNDNPETKSTNNIEFNQELEKIINQFDLVLKSKNDEDYPPPFWYDIVIEKSSLYERETGH